MSTHRDLPRVSSRLGGFTLIELMIAMVLGLLVIGAAFGIFLSSKRVYQASQGLGRMQESSQLAFEMMARDLREAGGSPCDSTIQAGNIVSGSPWYANWASPLLGYDSSGVTGQVAGTDAVQLVRTGDEAVTTTAAGVSSFTYTSTPSKTYSTTDVLMICDNRAFGIFIPASPAAGSVAVSSTANGCNYLPQPGAGTCAGTATQYSFPKFSTISSMQGARWFVRDPDANAANGYSLYRQVNAGSAEEMIEGVVDMQLTYLRNGAYVAASALGTPAEWGEVRAVRIALTLQETDTSSQASTTAGQLLRRTLQHTVAVRNRVL